MHIHYTCTIMVRMFSTTVQLFSMLHICYLTPERQAPAMARKGLTEPSDLWVSADAGGQGRFHSPDLRALGSPTRGC